MKKKVECGFSELSSELEAKLLKRLVFEWRAINYNHFKDVLRQPVLSLSNTRTRLGQWHGEFRSLEISRPLVLERSWPNVIEVLKHEMAHQYVDECTDSKGETAHGPTFARVCERLGIDSRATRKTSADIGDDPGNRAIEKVQKLLSLAQSSNRNEAEIAATMARRLMVKFNIDADTCQSKTNRNYGFRHLGSGSGRIFDYERMIAKILINYFFIEGIWLPIYRPHQGKRGTIFEICGLEHNLIIAEHVYEFLIATSERLWIEYKNDNKLSSNRDRQAFLSGIMSGFEEKLDDQNNDFQEKGLVWIPAPDLNEYFRRRFPRMSTIHRKGARRSGAYNAGAVIGKNIVLSKPVKSGGSNTYIKAIESAK